MGEFEVPAGGSVGKGKGRRLFATRDHSGGGSEALTFATAAAFGCVLVELASLQESVDRATVRARHEATARVMDS